LFESTSMKDLFTYKIAGTKALDGKTALLMGMLYIDKDSKDWAFHIISEGANGSTAHENVDELQDFIRRNPMHPLPMSFKDAKKLQKKVQDNWLVSLLFLGTWENVQIFLGRAFEVISWRFLIFRTICSEQNHWTFSSPPMIKALHKKQTKLSEDEIDKEEDLPVPVQAQKTAVPTPVETGRVEDYSFHAILNIIFPWHFAQLLIVRPALRESAPGSLWSHKRLNIGGLTF